MKKRSILPSIGFVALLVLTLAGCAGSSTVTKTSDSGAGFVELSGKVVETTDAGGYTYISLENNGQKTWVAVPTMKVKVGDELKLMPGAEMNGFTSKALNRTFEKIIFSGGPVQAVTEQALAGQKIEEAKAFAKPVLAGKVVETMDSKNYTYICLEKDNRKGWSAVPNTKVTVGDEIELIPGVDMGKFSSPGLKRTFDNIHFSVGVKGAKEEPVALPATHPAVKLKESPAKTGAPIAGKVVETMNAGGYSYVCLEKDGNKTWVAAPAMKVAVGDQLSFQPGSAIPNFTSKSLNRTFEKITFTNGLVAK